MSRPGPKKGKGRTNDNTAVSQQGRSGVRVLSTEAANAVGRPGFGGKIPGPVDGKASVKRVMRRDPAVGLTLPNTDRITTQKVDLFGPVNPRIITDSLASNPSAPNTGKKVVRPPRRSAPVNSNKPGKVTRPGSR